VPKRWFHCVSPSQDRTRPASRQFLPPIENGIDVDAFAQRYRKRGFALALGRICPEKGIHLALDAARLAGWPLVVAGPIFPYRPHRDYFETEIAPRLDPRRRYVGPVGFAAKRRLLQAASCLLVPSLAPETSSLVAMEALASGTPVIAFPNGALPDIVRHGETGFLVETVEEMAQAITKAGGLDPETCRAEARARFRRERMVAAYFALYRDLAEHHAACCGEAG
jgi:glycosyltransferase involved in cell wall biosynthesis